MNMEIGGTECGCSIVWQSKLSEEHGFFRCYAWARAWRCSCVRLIFQNISYSAPLPFGFSGGRDHHVHHSISHRLRDIPHRDLQCQRERGEPTLPHLVGTDELSERARDYFTNERDDAASFRYHAGCAFQVSGGSPRPFSAQSSAVAPATSTTPRSRAFRAECGR